MNTIKHIKKIGILTIAIVCIITLKGSSSNNKVRPNPVLEKEHYTGLVGIIDTELKDAELKISNSEDSLSNITINYKNVSIGVDIHKTYFIPGAEFHNRGDRSKENFPNELIDTFSTLLREDFVLVKQSPKKIPFKPLRSGINGKWAIMNGFKPIDYQKHKNVFRAIKEIESDISLRNKNITPNIIGSSYGSVIAAQSAIALLERDNDIDKIGILVITASMIDPDSELGLELEALKSEGKIEMIYYDPNSDDNITACSGKSKKEAKQGFRAVVFNTSPSIINKKKHVHNIAARDPQRAHHILEVLLQQSTIKWVDQLEK